MWSFGDDFAGNAAIFGVDNSSLSYFDNLKNNFLILSEGPNSDIDGSFSSPEEKFSINLVKTNTKFCLSFYCNVDINFLFLNGVTCY